MWAGVDRHKRARGKPRCCSEAGPVGRDERAACVVGKGARSCRSTLISGWIGVAVDWAGSKRTRCQWRWPKLARSTSGNEGRKGFRGERKKKRR